MTLTRLYAAVYSGSARMAPALLYSTVKGTSCINGTEPKGEEETVKHSSKSILKATVSVFALAAMLSACSSDSPVTSTTGTVSIGIGLTPNPASPGGNGADGPVTVGAVSAIQITSAEVVISRIRVKSVGEDTLDFNSTTPIVVNLDLAGAQQSIGTLSLPAGSYDETRFKIDQLDSLDGTVYTSNPNMQGISVRVAGYVNGSVDSTFLWTTTLDEEQVFQHTTPFTVVAGQTTNLSFHFDNSKWFVDQNNAMVDPRDGQNQSQIENNIKNAFDITENQAGIQ